MQAVTPEVLLLNTICPKKASGFCSAAHEFFVDADQPTYFVCTSRSSVLSIMVLIASLVASLTSFTACLTAVFTVSSISFGTKLKIAFPLNRSGDLLHHGSHRQVLAHDFGHSPGGLPY